MSRRGFYMLQMLQLLLAAYLVVGLSACSDGDDAKKKLTGDPCQNNTDCADNVCHDGMCAAASPKANGEACTSAAECLSYVCSHSKCEEGTKSLGTACLNGQECSSGSCVNNACADSARPDAGVDGPLPPDAAQPDVSQPDSAQPDVSVPDTLQSDTGGVYFFDDFSGGLAQWTCGTGWGTTNTTYNSGPVSIADTPSGDYLPGANSDCRLTKSLDLSTASAPILTFFHKYALWWQNPCTWQCEKHVDRIYVEVSTDAGFSWTEIKNYTGIQSSWSFEQLDLTPHIGAKVRVRFRLYSRSYSKGADGWYIDDVRIEELL